MIASSYSDPRLAAIYDALNPPGPDDAFYTELAGDRALNILDVGCGTGRLACDLAVRGHSVTGVDPSEAMLDVARRRPGGERAVWIKGTATEISLERRFDLIIMTGHAFQVLLSDRAIRAALRTLRSHMAPAGTLAFETRNRAMREWEEWSPSATRQTLSVPGVGDVEVHNDIRAVIGSVVTYETHFRFGVDGTLVTADSIRFLEHGELDGFLKAAGFCDVSWFGDWDRSVLRSSSREIIVLAKS
jgi:SAM-dependent methyltransferase